MCVQASCESRKNFRAEHNSASDTVKCEVACRKETPPTDRAFSPAETGRTKPKRRSSRRRFPISSPSLRPGDRGLTASIWLKWIVDPQNPLTARVFVNRTCGCSLYGVGIHRKRRRLWRCRVSRFNPELLDYLATEFVNNGGEQDIKHVVRLIVTSSSYRQSSAGSKELRDRDPYNRLVARQSPIRIDAEFVRDNAMAIANILNPDLGGESSKPYQPDGYWDFLNFPKRTYPTDHGAAGHRRGVYTWWQRTFVHPWLLAFDASTREECVAARTRSNTPLQALDLLNDPIFVEAARAFADRVLPQGQILTGDDAHFCIPVTCLSRRPTVEEKTILLSLLDDHMKQYIADPQSAAKLVAIGDVPIAKDTDKVELAAWTSVTRTIINLHETITRF